MNVERGNFKLVCKASNEPHTQFALFDADKALCGTITILTSDVIPFTNRWRGEIEWGEHFPKELDDLIHGRSRVCLPK